MSQSPVELHATSADAGKRLDQFLVAHLPDVSRAHVQNLIEQGKVAIGGKLAKPSYKLHGDETIIVTGPAQPEPLRAIAEDIPLDIVYEDRDLAVINKPAGMMVHAGAGATDDDRNRGTLVNALLHRFNSLSNVGGELRPGVVHRLDRNTSGLIVIAKNDFAHRHLAGQFAGREIGKKYIALVQGWFKEPKGTIKAAISRDLVRRARMTVKGSGGRPAVSHYTVTKEFESPYGKFSLAEVKIETGRTHQIRVHLASLGHPIVGDTLYGAAEELKPKKSGTPLKLNRQFLHAAELSFRHPRSGKSLSFRTGLTHDLCNFLALVTGAGAESSKLPERL